ncbi:MAG TPA: gluconate 2-dehydrogenase subunit 3 family protein [Vicinamibacterales bacterium]|nr:gluconate 2-dehydrogenase subunit 3 family protein [Vicinamibacterales bacterium]
MLGSKEGSFPMPEATTRSGEPAARGLTRREALRALGAGAGAVAFVPWLSDQGLLAFARIQQTQAPPQYLVLSPAQYATLEALVETIIPADERSPGAKEARVADYIDLLLSESDDEVKLQWLGGLAELDEEAAARYGASFARLGDADREALVAEIARNEADPKTPVEAFFVMAKHATIRGYYTSEIGIHKELRYKGNQILAAFVGCATEDGKDCPHCGQKATPGP